MLMVVAWLSLRNTKEMLVFDRNESQADDVIGNLDQLLFTLKDSESVEHSLIIGDHKYLESYRNTRAHLNQDLAALRRLTENKPQQRRRMQEIEASIQEMLDELKQAIDLRQSQNIEATLSKGIESLGQEHMPQIWQQVNEFHTELDRLRQEQVTTKAARSHSLLMTIVAGYCLSFSLLFMVFVLLRKQIFKRLQAEASLVAQQGLLEQTVTQRTCELEVINAALTRENEKRKQAEENHARPLTAALLPCR